MKNNFADRIERNQSICGGEPVIKGTRVRLKVVLDNLAEGHSAEEIKRSYPSLSLEDIHAAIAFAAASASDDLTLPLKSIVFELDEI